MLTVAITVLFTLTGLVAVATIVHCLVEARAAYARLMREGEVMRAGLALQAAAIEMSLRPTPRRVVATRRAVMPLGPRLPLPACAAA
jgi:hypothetical protein